MYIFIIIIQILFIFAYKPIILFIMKGQIAVILALVAASISIISCNNAANEPKDAIQAALEAYKYVPDTTIKAQIGRAHV